MKHYFLLAVLLGAFSAQAQEVGVRRFPIFEHFTSSNCGPCAQQNPIFQENVLSKNYGTIHHIAYHTNFPAPDTDPMHLFNKPEALARQNYYAIQGVPNMHGNGNDYGSPVAVTQEVVNDLSRGKSPLGVKVSDMIMGDMHHATVTIETAAAAEFGNNLKLRVAIVEKLVEYVTAPGSNGEKEFPNVFRDMLTDTDATSLGESITPAPVGQSLSFNYMYEIDETWNPDNIYVVAWVQNDDTKEVINSGATYDPKWHIDTNDQPFKKGTALQVSEFSGVLVNEGEADDFEVQLLSPTQDWLATMEINGTTYDANATNIVSLPANSTTPYKLKVLVGPAGGIHRFSVSLKQQNTEYSPNSNQFYAIANVRDLVLNNALSGNGTTNTDIFNGKYYSDGLAAAGNTTYGNLDVLAYNQALQYDVLDDIKNIYYNIGWTFPAFTDETIGNLITHLEGGGNLLICGQDVAWDVFDTASGAANGTAAQREFLKNYMGVDFSNDGSTANSQLTPVADDEIYGSLGNSAIAHVYVDGSEDFFYPDELTLASGVSTATATFKYNNGTKIAGIRNHTPNYKTSYLGIGIEMIENEAVRNEFMNITHDWFYEEVIIDGITTINDKKLNLFPNPCINDLYLSSVQDNQYEIVISDALGKIVFQSNLAADTQKISLAHLTKGVYWCQMKHSGTIFDTRLLIKQ